MSQDSAPPAEPLLPPLPSARTLAVILVVAVMLAYARLWWAGFIWDDDDYLINNTCLRSLAGLGRIWFSPGSTSQYYPLTHTSFWIEYHLWGLNAPLYHFVNVLLHAANALLLWAVLHRLAVPAPWLGAALFALHPVEVESVAWITERKNTLSAFFGLLFLLAWLRYRFGPSEQGAPIQPKLSCEQRPVDFRWLAVATALFLASLLCKTVTITLLGAVLVISWWKTGRISRADVIGIVPLLVIGLPLALTTVAMEKTTVGAVGDEWSLTPADRIVLAGRVIVFYLSKLVWPQPLIFFYPRWTVSAAEIWQWVFPAGVAAVLGLLWFFRDRLGRGPLACSLLFIGMLFPALGFFDVYPFQYSYVADHFQYHASAAALAGLAAAAWLAAERLSDSRLRLVSIGAWLAVLASITAAQTRPYLSLGHLYRHVLAHDAGSYIAANNLGMFLTSFNKMPEAASLFRMAAENAHSSPQKGLALWNVCQASLRYDDLAAVAECSLAAFEAHPTVATRSMRALALARTGEPSAAERLLSDVPLDLPERRVPLADALDIHCLAVAEAALGKGDSEKASRALETLLLNTENEWSVLEAARTFARLGDDDRAAQIFGSLRNSLAHGGSAFYGLGELAIEQGNLDVAQACFRLAIDRNPGLVAAYQRLAAILYRQHRQVDAEVALLHGLRMTSGSPELASLLETIRASSR
jgi:tetratricopeptide (TPR) repeat protein